MKRSHFLWRAILGIALVMIGYAAVFHWIEHRRVTKGPWVVAFTMESALPILTINQLTLGIRDVRIVFPDRRAGTIGTQVVKFSQARAVPFDVPFGRCVFLDPMFLPGTAALEIFGHEIQLLPRVLTIDRVERPWRSGETIELRKTSTPK